ncbi:MAG TPA: hypothetical protein VET48_10655 [Steroidobacteraceae bacterium]|nr:hypothetical protein [Steroidobacteraceae bacterium]
MSAIKAGLLVGLGVLALAQAARADDQPFLTLYTTDIDSAQEKEVEQQISFNAQKPGQAYSDFLSRTEFEYGVTADFQVSLYGNYELERMHPHVPLAVADNENEFSVSGEAIYRFLNVYFDPVGLAVYLEPSFGSDDRELEAKILLQKNFFNDTLRLAFNTNFENRWEHDSGVWNRWSAIEFRVGAAYNLTSAWSLCAEFSNENNFDGLVGGAHPASNVYYVGPTISYKGLPLTITFGAQAQLPWANDPTHTVGAINQGFSADAERWRIGLFVSRDI